MVNPAPRSDSEGRTYRGINIFNQSFPVRRGGKLRGPLDQAEDALRSMYDAVRGDAVLARIFSLPQGQRRVGSKV